MKKLIKPNNMKSIYLYAEVPTTCDFYLDTVNWDCPYPGGNCCAYPVIYAK